MSSAYKTDFRRSGCGESSALTRSRSSSMYARRAVSFFCDHPIVFGYTLEPSRPLSGDARIDSPARDKFPRRILLVLLLLWRCLSGVSKVTGEGGIRTLGSLL